MSYSCTNLAWKQKFPQNHRPVSVLSALALSKDADIPELREETNGLHIIPTERLQ